METTQEMLSEYKVWSPVRGGGTPSVDAFERMLECCVKDEQMIAQRFKRKGTKSHRQLSKMYRDGGYRDAAVQGALIIPKSGPFAGIPLTVRSPDTERLGKGVIRWGASPLFSEGGRKAKPTGWHVSISKEDL